MKPGAVRALDRVPQRALKRLIARIRKLAEDPGLEGSEPVSGSGQYRLRHEDFRVVYWVDRDAMCVVVGWIGIRRRRPVSEGGD